MSMEMWQQIETRAATLPSATTKPANPRRETDRLRSHSGPIYAAIVAFD